MAWVVEFHEDYLAEFKLESKVLQKAVFMAARYLEHSGPQLRRPQADTLSGSSYANMKELRITVPGGEWRVAYAFDPERKAILLTGASKSGVGQKDFYLRFLRTADERYTKHLNKLTKKREKENMGVPLSEVMEQLLTPEERVEIERRVQEMIEEEMTLRKMRTVQQLTQKRVAELLGVQQDSVSRMERRADMLLSTMSSYVEAMGGRLRLVAEFPDRKPFTVKLSDLAEEVSEPGKRKTTISGKKKVASKVKIKPKPERTLKPRARVA